MYGTPLLSELLKETDIAVVTEHWLLPEQMNFLQSIDSNFKSYGLSDTRISLEPERRVCNRGFGGLAILWRKEINISKQFGSKNHLRPNDRGEILEPFIVDKDLVSINSQAWAKGGTSTFVSKTGNGSLIDHMFIESRRVDCVEECSTLDDNYLNVSDHLPIRIRYRTPLLVREHAGNPYAVNWKKCSAAQLTRYSSQVSALLREPFPRNTDTANVDHLQCLVNNIVEATRTASKDTLPSKKYRPYLKPYWNAGQVKAFHKTMRERRVVWIQDGRPRGSQFQSYRDYKRCKRDFRRELDQARHEYEQSEFQSLQQAAEIDSGTFYRAVRARKITRRETSEIKVNGEISRDPDINRAAWTAHYSELAQFSTKPIFDETHKLYIESEVTRMRTDSYTNANTVCREYIVTKEVSSALKEMKNGKAGGHDHLIVEHLRYGGTINFPHRLQQGFRSNCGSITAAFTVREAVFHHFEISTTVFAAFLDNAKAFNSVWVNGLLYKLYHLGFNGKIWRLLQNSFEDVSACVLYEGKRGEPYKVMQGVGQGRTLSSWMFLIMIDELISNLDSSLLGLHIHDIHIPSVFLADDTLLLSCSVGNIQRLLDIVFEFSCKWRLNYNSTKSSLLRFCNSRKKFTPEIQCKLGDQKIAWVTQKEYAGIILTPTLQCDEDIKRSCAKGRRSLNSLISVGIHDGGMNPITSSKLVETIVQPVILYGSELWGAPTLKSQEDLRKTQRYAARRCQGFEKTSPTLATTRALGMLDICGEVEQKKLIFWNKLCSAINKTFYLTMNDGQL
ncbi:uncharacterized protein [Argopecten irradians]|uniref:uncharacterized protein n=1 Tax=Argopecten irradians TaxID=31199 RepID=UPI0037144F64